MHAMTRDVSGVSGLDQLRQALADPDRPGIGRLLGMVVEELAEGRVVFSLETRPDMANPMGIVHGGIASTLLDSAMGCAVHTTLPAGAAFTTLQLGVQFTRAVRVDHGTLTCVGTLLHRGSRTATAEGTVVDGDGRLVAHGTTTCMIMPAGG
jgi:uncharacterized protein (TIGR00369 family)